MRLFISSPSSTAGRLQDEDVTRVDVDRALPTEVDQTSVSPTQQVKPSGSSLSTGKTVGLKDTTICENWKGERFPEKWLPENTVSTTELSVSSGSFSERKSFKDDRISTLKNFGVGQSRVCHVDVYTGATMPAWTGTWSTSNGLVISRIRIWTILKWNKKGSLIIWMALIRVAGPKQWSVIVSKLPFFSLTQNFRRRKWCCCSTLGWPHKRWRPRGWRRRFSVRLIHSRQRRQHPPTDPGSILQVWWPQQDWDSPRNKFKAGLLN